MSTRKVRHQAVLFSAEVPVLAEINDHFYLNTQTYPEPTSTVQAACDVSASWERERCGFSVFVGPVIPAEDREGLSRLISYLFRSPVSFRRLE